MKTRSFRASAAANADAINRCSKMDGGHEEYRPFLCRAVHLYKCSVCVPDRRSSTALQAALQAALRGCLLRSNYRLVLQVCGRPGSVMLENPSRHSRSHQGEGVAETSLFTQRCLRRFLLPPPVPGAPARPRLNAVLTSLNPAEGQLLDRKLLPGSTRGNLSLHQLISFLFFFFSFSA